MPICVVVAAACTGGAHSRESPSLEARESADAEVTSPKEAPEAAEPATETVPAKAELVMRPVAFRDGSFSGLLVRRGHLLIDMEGEPVPIRANGLPERLDVPARGFKDGRLQEIAALATDADGTPTWLTTSSRIGRSTPEREVLHYEKSRWIPKVERRGPLVAYYASLVQVGDATFGLRAYLGNPQTRASFDKYIFDGGFFDDRARKKAEAFEQQVKATLEGTRPEFVVVSGRPAFTPKVPKQPSFDQLVAGRDGTLYAVVVEGAFPAAAGQLLVWSPRAEAPTVVDLPRSPAESTFERIELTMKGTRPVVWGVVAPPGGGPMRPYLATGPGTTWTVPSMEGAPFATASANSWDTACVAAGPDDALMVEWRGDLWHRSSDTAWAQVTLPAVALGSLEPDKPGQVLDARHVAWADGAWWAIGTQSDDVYGDTAVRVLYTSRPGPEAPVELPSSDDLRLERAMYGGRGPTVPGADRCASFSMVLGPPGALDEIGEVGLAALRDLNEELVGVVPRETGDPDVLPTRRFYSLLNRLYVGSIDGSEELVLEGYAATKLAARRLSSKVARALDGRKPSLDCRPRRTVRDVATFDVE